MNLKFEPIREDEFVIDPKEIAKLVYTILSNKSVISDITIRPQRVGIKKRNQLKIFTFTLNWDIFDH